MAARDFSGLFLASACLCGTPCRYDGKATPHPVLVDLCERGFAVAACPEMLGGLPAPRLPAERAGDRIMTRDGRDLTEPFALGAAKTLEIALARGISVAVLKERSPSCGVFRIYDGTFSSRIIPGSGMTANLLRANGLVLYNEETFINGAFFSGLGLEAE